MIEHLLIDGLWVAGGGAGSFGVYHFRGRLLHRKPQGPILMSDYELHRMELSVGVTPEGMALETQGIIKEIDDELLKLDGVDPEYKTEVELSRTQNKLINSFAVPDATI